MHNTLNDHVTSFCEAFKIAIFPKRSARLQEEFRQMPQPAARLLAERVNSLANAGDHFKAAMLTSIVVLIGRHIYVVTAQDINTTLSNFPIFLSALTTTLASINLVYQICCFNEII